MEPIDKLAGKDTSNIGMLPSASKYVSIKFADQCIHILNNKQRLNILKDIKKMKNRESLLKYQRLIYNVQRNSDVNPRGIKLIWNKKCHDKMLLMEKYRHIEARVF